ncbi:uncharacterized protein [Montipora capricornis]|uniref:uncharacterized protein isoform X1 n=2 Tax=Montipora capricornis TaxID=246305 RepID=UPI0035F11D68
MALIRTIIESMRKDEIEKSILVLNIPPGTKEDSLFIHFQRGKHGGGDVSSVKFLQGVSEDGTTAIVTFEDAETVNTVLNADHQVQGRILKVHRCSEKLACSTDEVFTQITAKLNSIVLGDNPRETMQILERMKSEVGISFEREAEYFLIMGSLSQINTCQLLLQEHLVKEQNISDTDTRSSFEDVNDQAGHRLMEKDILSQRIAHTSEYAGTIVTGSLETRPPLKVQYLGNVRQEDTKEITYPIAEKKTFKAKSLAISFVRQCYRSQMQSILEKCHFEFDEKGGEIEVTLKPKLKCDSSLFMVACYEFSELLQSATHGMVTWELNSTCEDVETVVPLIHKLLTKFPVILEQPQESGPMVVYGDAASVSQLKLRVKEATSPSDDDFPTGAQVMSLSESGILSIETCKHHTENGIHISLRYGDITNEDVDAIVNPANALLLHGAGLAQFIVQKGGNEIVTESKKLMKARHYKTLKAGEAVHTKAGDLPCKFVIHAIGPEWNKQSQSKTHRLLQKACFESLKLASTLNLSSIALPAISSGVFGVPVNECAFAMLEGIQEYLKYLDELNENKEKDCKTKKPRENYQKNGGKKTKGTKHDGQTKEVPAQAAKHVCYKPRLRDIRVVLIDADAMDVFSQEFMSRFGGSQSYYDDSSGD